MNYYCRWKSIIVGNLTVRRCFASGQTQSYFMVTQIWFETVRQTMLWLTKNVNRERGKLQIGPEVSWRIINVTFPWHLVGGIAEEPEEGEEGSWDMSQWGDRETGRTTGQKEHRQQQWLPPWASWQILQLQLILVLLCTDIKTQEKRREEEKGRNTNRPTNVQYPLLKWWWNCTFVAW